MDYLSLILMIIISKPERSQPIMIMQPLNNANGKIIMIMTRDHVSKPEVTQLQICSYTYIKTRETYPTKRY